MDPIDLRLLNAAEEGDSTVYGAKFQAIGLKEVLQKAKEHPNYQVALGESQGRGVAVGFWFNIGLQSSATVNVHNSGKITVITGNPDIGGSRASMALMAAETMGIGLENIKPIIGDTDAVGYSDLTGGSRTTFASGWAVIKACEALIEKLKERAALTWDVDVSQVEWKDGLAVADGQEPLSLAALAAQAGQTGGPLSSSAFAQRSGCRTRFQCKPVRCLKLIKKQARSTCCALPPYRMWAKPFTPPM